MRIQTKRARETMHRREKSAGWVLRSVCLHGQWIPAHQIMDHLTNLSRQRQEAADREIHRLDVEMGEEL